MKIPQLIRHPDGTLCRRSLPDPYVIPDAGCSESSSTRYCHGCDIHIEVLSWPDHVQSFNHQIKFKLYLTLLSFCWYKNKHVKPHYPKGCEECQRRTKINFFGPDTHPHHNLYTYDADKDEDYKFIKKTDKHIEENPVREKKEFYCEVCDLQMYTALYFEAHLKGKCHREKSGEGVLNSAGEGFYNKKAGSKKSGEFFFFFFFVNKNSNTGITRDPRATVRSPE